MTNLIRCLTPFPVEYSGRSGERRGGAPTLVQCADGCAVYAGLIVLNKYDNPEDLSQVRDELGKREGLNSGKSKSIKDDREMQGFRVVYSDFEVKITAQELTPATLAEFAKSSVAQCAKLGHPLCNGIRYLSENMEWGVKTKLTEGYRNAILGTRWTSLHHAEAELLRRSYKNRLCIFGR